MRPERPPRGFTLRPQPGVDTRELKREGLRRDRVEDPLYERQTAGAMSTVGTMHTVEELGRRDGGDGDVLRIRQRAGAPFDLDQERGVEERSHLSFGSFG